MWCGNESMVWAVDFVSESLRLLLSLRKMLPPRDGPIYLDEKSFATVLPSAPSTPTQLVKWVQLSDAG